MSIPDENRCPGFFFLRLPGGGGTEVQCSLARGHWTNHAHFPNHDVRLSPIAVWAKPLSERINDTLKNPDQEIPWRESDRTIFAKEADPDKPPPGGLDD